jgi:hypothetical protein
MPIARTAGGGGGGAADPTVSIRGMAASLQRPSLNFGNPFQPAGDSIVSSPMPARRAPVDYGPTPSNGPSQDNQNHGMDGLLPPPPMAGPEPSPAAPALEAPEPGGNPIPMMPPSMSAVTPIPAPAGSLNPNLGRRLYPQSMRALTEMAGRNY